MRESLHSAPAFQTKYSYNLTAPGLRITRCLFELSDAVPCFCYKPWQDFYTWITFCNILQHGRQSVCDTGPRPRRCGWRVLLVVSMALQHICLHPNAPESESSLGSFGLYRSRIQENRGPKPSSRYVPKYSSLEHDQRTIPDYVLENVWKAHGSPDFMFFDTRPAQYPLALITSHDIAEQLSRSTKQQPYSTTKSPTIQGGLKRLIGPYSLLSEEGESWKSLRKRFNPGFAPQHLLSLLPVVLDKTYIFMEKLDAVSACTCILPYTHIDATSCSWRDRELLPS